MKNTFLCMFIVIFNVFCSAFVFAVELDDRCDKSKNVLAELKRNDFVKASVNDVKLKWKDIELLVGVLVKNNRMELVDRVLPLSDKSKVDKAFENGNMDKVVDVYNNAVSVIKNDYMSISAAISDCSGSKQSNVSLDSSIIESISKLKNECSKKSTDSSNVNERFHQLNSIIQKLASSVKSESLDSILSKQDMQNISRQLDSKNYTAAVEGVNKSLNNLFARFKGQDIVQNSGLSLKNAVALGPSKSINLYSLTSGASFKPVLKLGMATIDVKGRKLYVSGTKSTSMSVIDIDTERQIDCFDIGIHGGFLLFDDIGNDIYLFQIDSKKYYKINPNLKTCKGVTSLPSHMKMPDPKSKIKFDKYNFFDTGFPFMPGYLQDQNASYGVINVEDSSTGKVIRKIYHGPDALYFSIDPVSGKIFAINTGDASVSIYSIKDDFKKNKDLSIGMTIEEIVPLTGDVLAIRNRLGGSTIVLYNIKNNSVKIIENENKVKNGIGLWPTQMFVHNSQLYILSHYAARIDVYDAKKFNYLKSINLKLELKPRTDAISSMVLDAPRNRIFVSVPELGTLISLNADTGAQLNSRKLLHSPKNLSGPFQMSMSVDSSTGDLFMSMPGEGVLLKLDGSTLNEKKRVSFKPDIYYTMFNTMGYLYAGNKIFSTSNLDSQGELGAGENVVAYDAKTDKLYIQRFEYSQEKGRGSEIVYELSNGQAVRQWTMQPMPGIPCNYYFDFLNKKFYSGYFELGIIEQYGL